MKCCSEGPICRYKCSGLKRKRVTRNLRELFANTTWQGISKVIDTKLGILERFLWLLIVLTCTGLCIFCIYSMLQKWNNSPDIKVIEKSTPISDIPFPAITICPDNMIPKSKLDLAVMLAENLVYLHKKYPRIPIIQSKTNIDDVKNETIFNSTEIVVNKIMLNGTKEYEGLGGEEEDEGEEEEEYEEEYEEEEEEYEEAEEEEEEQEGEEEEQEGEEEEQKGEEEEQEGEEEGQEGEEEEQEGEEEEQEEEEEGEEEEEEDEELEGEEKQVVEGEGKEQETKEEKHNYKIYETDEWAAASLICKHFKNHKIINDDHLETLFKISTGSEQFLRCKWDSEDSKCSDIFHPILTDLGVCFTFNKVANFDMFKANIEYHEKSLNNMKQLQYWNKTEIAQEQIYQKQENNPKLGDEISKTNKHSILRRASSKKSELEIMLNSVNEELQSLCWPNAKGYKMLVHSPDEFPKMSNQHFHIPVNSLVTVAVKPTMVTTSEALKANIPLIRECYFPGERELKVYKIYSQNNCEMECLRTKVQEKCDCIPFHYPTFGSNDSRYCNPAHSVDDTCVEKVKEDWSSELKPCNCLPSCTEIKYDVEISNSELKKDEFEFYFNPDIIKMDQSKIVIHFKDNKFTTKEKQVEDFDIVGFIAKCGGLLGLFTGLSVISVIEMVYCVTFKICCRIKRRRSLDNNDEEQSVNNFSQDLNNF